MDDHEHRPEKQIPSGASENTKNAGRNEKISNFFDKAHSVDALHFIAGFSQVFLGLVVVVISVMGLIQPFWLSTTLSIVASVTTMIGVYFCYSAVSNFDTDTLLRDAMRRIVEDQNWYARFP